MESSYKSILTRVKSSRRDWIMNVLTFIFPFLSVITAFAIQKVYPVGDRIMMTVDSYHQYVPFLIEFRNKVLEGRSLLFSWNSGLGMEFFAAFTNYAASPLNVFCLFFTAKTMPVFVALVTALRAGLSGLFMSFFLTGEDEGRRDYITTAFACAYALCGWFCTNFWNIMWCDALFLLPLVLIGLRSLFVEGKYAFYVVTLALTIITNYYTGFFICLFLVFFAPVYYFCIFQTKHENIIEGKIGFKTFALSAFRFILGSLIAGGITAVILLPTYKILQTTSAVGTEFPKNYDLTGNLFDFLGRFMVAANPNIRDGMANVYTGIIPILMLPLFFAADKSTGIKLRHKISMAIVLVILYLSFSNRTLNFIWHGFHFPNQIPYRESFLMSFVVIFIGYKTIRVLKSFTLGQLSATFIGGGVFLILFEKFGSGNETYIQILISMLFVIIEGVALRSTVTGKKSSLFYETLVSAFMAVEMLASCCVSVAFVSDNEGFPLYKTYGQNYDVIKNYVNEVENSDGHKAFERTEIYPNNICNIQSVYDVRGFSVFSSTVRKNNVLFIKNFGFHNNGINSYRSAGLTRVTATLFGIRNFITTGDTDTVPPIFDYVTTVDDSKVYENKDALSVGYMVSDKILDFEPDPLEKNAFTKTNLLVRNLGVNEDMFRRIDSDIEEMNNVALTASVTGQYTYSIVNAGVSTNFTTVVNTDNSGSDVCLYLDCGKPGTYVINKYDSNGELLWTSGSIAYRYYQILPLGIADGSTYKCTFKFTNSPSGSIKMYSYALNRPGYDAMVEKLSTEQLVVTDYDDTSIKGTITTEEGGILMLTIAYNDGFKLVVDGEKQEIVTIGDALIGVKLTPGTHTIELYYAPSGFTEGILITGISFALFLLVLFIKFFGTKVIKHHSSVASDSDIKTSLESLSDITESETNDGAMNNEQDEPLTESEETTIPVEDIPEDAFDSSIDNNDSSIES